MLGRLPSLLALFAALIVGAAAAQDRPPNFTVNVDTENSKGRILVNGVPIEAFGGDASPFPGMGVAVGTGMWMVAGENSIVVEAEPAGDNPLTRIVILRSIADPPVYEGEIKGAGRAEHKVKVDKIIRWSWLDAEKWQGDKAELLAAVRALHAAYAAKDQPKIEKTRAALDADFDAAMGPPKPEEREQEKAFLGKAKLDPLPADFTVTPYYDGRLLAVTRADGMAPILLATPDVPGKSEIAKFWVKKGGTWQVVR